jgi:hypothetical protein
MNDKIGSYSISAPLQNGFTCFPQHEILNGIEFLVDQELYLFTYMLLIYYALKIFSLTF